MSNLNFKLFLEKEETASTIPDALATNLNIPFKIFKKAWKAVGPTPVSQGLMQKQNGTKLAIPVTPVEIDFDCNLEDQEDNCKYANIQTVDMPNEFLKIKNQNYIIPKDKQYKIKTMIKGGKKIDQLVFGNLIPALMQQPGQAGETPGAGPGTPPGGPLL